MEGRTTIQVSEGLRKKLKALAAKRDESYQDVLNDMVDVFGELDTEKTVVSIPKQLSEKLKINVASTDCKTLSEYITFVLRLVLYEESEKERIDEQHIRKKLQKLGYLEG